MFPEKILSKYWYFSKNTWKCVSMATSCHGELNILWKVYDPDIAPLPSFVFPQCLPRYLKFRRDLLYRFLRSRCPPHHLIHAYTNLGAPGTADFLTLFRLLAPVYYWNKKKAAPYFEIINKKNKSWKHFSVEVIFKDFLNFLSILDQSQICISNGLGSRACQSYLLYL